MSDCTQFILLLPLFALLDRFLKPYPLRKWLGLSLTVVGPVVGFLGSQTHVLGFDLGLLSIFCISFGIGLFRRRRRFDLAD
ncbi:hypothetical protein [Pseudomonas phoenicis]|uniref:hypothetical protein n=1 Tax=unclassified Pseudomonas TaxID=196821 RepID=UPI0039A245AD